MREPRAYFSEGEGTQKRDQSPGCPGGEKQNRCSGHCCYHRRCPENANADDQADHDHGDVKSIKTGFDHQQVSISGC